MIELRLREHSFLEWVFFAIFMAIMCGIGMMAEQRQKPVTRIWQTTGKICVSENNGPIVCTNIKGSDDPCTSKYESPKY